MKHIVDQNSIIIKLIIILKVTQNTIYKRKIKLLTKRNCQSQGIWKTKSKKYQRASADGLVVRVQHAHHFGRPGSWLWKHTTCLSVAKLWWWLTQKNQQDLQLGFTTMHWGFGEGKKKGRLATDFGSGQIFQKKKYQREANGYGGKRKRNVCIFEEKKIKTEQKKYPENKHIKVYYNGERTEGTDQDYILFQGSCSTDVYVEPCS